jgi:hypothetical protein
MRRGRRDLFHRAGPHETDLCDADGGMFLNTCRSLGEMSTVLREAGAMAGGRQRWPKADGRMLYHEPASPGAPAIPGAEPAWRFLLGPGV